MVVVSTTNSAPPGPPCAVWLSPWQPPARIEESATNHLELSGSLMADGAEWGRCTKCVAAWRRRPAAAAG